MRLTVGITERTPEWEIVLGQIGVPTEAVDLHHTLQTDRYAVIIVCKSNSKRGRENLLHFLSQGGAILVEADVAEWLLNIKTVPAYVKYVEPAEDAIFEGVMSGFLDRRLTLPRGATVLRNNSGKELIEIHTYGKGTAFILPGSFSEAVLDTKVRRRNFPAPISSLPSERVSRPSKQTIREIIQRSLEYLYEQRHLPFVFLWPFPDGAQTVFGFRIDTDFSPWDKIDRLYQLCHRHQIPATWFVETASAEDFVDNYARMEDQEIGLHCFRHRVCTNFIKCERDIRRGINILNRTKIRPHGYAAPFGEWNISLAKAVEHHGFTYSSEFAQGYDDLPFYPYLGDRFSPVLQIPIHPITTSCLRNAHHGTGEMQTYFQQVIGVHTAHHLPIFLYDHPSNANIDALNWIFEQIGDSRITSMHLVEYALWWKRRQTLQWTVDFDEGELQFDHSGGDPSVWLGIRRGGKEWTAVETKEAIPLDSLQWMRNNRKAKPRTPVALRASLNRKMILNDILHTYWKYSL